MKFDRLISMAMRSIRALVIVFACAVFVLSNALPAAAIGSNPTRTDEGDTRLDQIFRKSEEVTKAPPLGMEETQREANRGINEIQGSADKEQMNRPENSQATSVADQVEEVLENITGKK